MRRVFISYHHKNDQAYKDYLVRMADRHDIFVDWSVEVGDISDTLSHQAIRRKIRDEYLQDSTVTILLVGVETCFRKHVDWELKSSMIDGAVNKRSGILVINLPSVSNSHFTAAHDGEKQFYPETKSWMSISSRDGYDERYPFMPDRIIDNLLEPKAKVSVVNWERIQNDPDFLKWLVEATADARLTNEYDCSRDMRMKDYNP